MRKFKNSFGRREAEEKTKDERLLAPKKIEFVTKPDGWNDKEKLILMICIKFV